MEPRDTALSSADRLARLCAPAGDTTHAPRTLLVVAHPFDEIVGASSRLIRANIAACVYATDGEDDADAIADDEATAAARVRASRAETLRALAHAGISSERAVFLGCPPEQAAHRLLSLYADIRRWIIATLPDVVLTHAYEGFHSDRDAVAFAVHAAVGSVAHDDGDVPTIIEFPLSYAAAEDVTPGEFLPIADTEQRIVKLTSDGRALKQRQLACRRTLLEATDGWEIGEERFRVAQPYDFSRPPHDCASYEFQRQPMTVDAWCELTTNAIEQLAQTDQICVLK